MKRVLQLTVAFLAALFAQSTLAATPVVVWDGDFKTDTKTGTNNDTFTLAVNGNSVAADTAGSSVTIADTERKGVYINWTTTFDAATILVKYSGLTTDDKTYPMGLLGFSKASQDNVDGLAVHTANRNVKAYWGGAYAYSMTNPEPTLTMDGTSTKLALKYSNGGTHSRVSYNGGTWSNLYTRNNIMGQNSYSMIGAVVGGSRALSYSGTNVQVAKGMQITGIAIFNSVLSDDDIANYYFPSECVAKIGEDGYGTISAAITAAGSNETTITLIKATSEDVTIPENVTLSTTKTNKLTGTIDGAGTIVYNAESTSESSGLTVKNTWSGKVHLKNIAQASGYYQLPFNSLGNAASMVALENVTGYVAGGAINPTVDLVGNGWNLNAGGSSNVTTIKLAGSGTLTIPAGCTATQVVKVTNTDFAGNISNAGNISVVFGEAGGNYDKNTYKTTIYVASGKTIAVGSGKTWAANNGIVVDGELTVNGNISSGLKGVGKVAMTGFPTNQAVLDSLANSAWKGTLSIASIEKTGEINLAPYGNASSTLEINGLTGATRYLKNGSNIPFTLKVSGDLTFNQGSSSTTYTIAKVTGSGNLSFLNWSGSANNDANHGYTITKLEGYTGTLTTTRFTTIAELALTSEPNIGDKLVTLGNGSQNTIKVNSVTVVGQALTAEKRVEIRADGIYCVNGEVTSEETMEVFGVKNVDVIRIGNGGTQKFAGTAGIRTTELTIKNGGKLVNDPIKNPIYVTGGAPTLHDGAKIALTEKYAAYTKGVFTLMTWDGDTTSTTVIPEDLFAATEAQQTNGPKLTLETYTTHVDNSKGTAKTYTALKLDLDPNGVKPKLKIMPLGDSITEGSNPDGLANPNYRVILMAKMASLGYDVSSTGMRMIKNWNAAGIYQPMEWSWHSGVSGQTLVSTGSRAGWRDSLEAMLDSAEIPDIITFKIGTNDSLAGRNVDQSVAEWVEVMRRIIKARPSTKIIVGSIMPFQGGGTWGSGENSWNAKLKKAIEENTYDFPEGQVFYAPLAENCLRTMDGKDNFVDSLHPNWTGHERNAETWATTITAALTAYPSAPGTYTPNEKLGAAENVGADYIKGFTKLAAYSPDNTVITKDGEINYSFKLSGLDTAAITKVGYYVELKNERSGNVRWVWADMDNWNEDKSFSKIAIPTAYTYCGSAQNLHVDSNDEGIEKIAPTVSGKTAWLQFTRGDLLKDTAAEGAPAAYSPRDWNDACDDSGNYGVMNLYRVAPTAVEGGVNALPAQVLMAYSRWTSDKQQIGVGNFMVHGQPLVYGNINDMPVNYYGTQDFERLNLASYTVANIEIWGMVKAEAKIGDTYFKTLQDAITAAENGDTVTLLQEVEITGLFVSGKAIILEHPEQIIDIDPVQGTSIVPAVNAECVTKLGTWQKACLIGDFEKCVDLMANTELNKGPIKTKYNFGGYLGFFVGKNITLSKDILLPAYNSTAAAVWFVAPEGDAENGLTLELNGYEIRQTFADNGNGYTGHPAVNSCTGYLTINDSSDGQSGAIIGSTTALGVRDYTKKATGVTEASHMTLNGGTIITQGGDRATAKNLGYCVAVYGTFVMNGGTLKVDETKNGSIFASVCSYYESNGTKTVPTFVMNGGEILDPSAEYSTYGSLLMYGPTTITDGLVEGEMTFFGETTITGGSFTEPVDEDYWPSGYAFVKDAESGLYSKVEAAACVVDEEGEIEIFATLKEAFAKANGKTVKLLENQQLDVTKTADSLKVAKDVTITLDLNGYVLASVATAATSSQLILNEGTLTIMDSSDTNKDGTGSGKIVVNADPSWQYDGDPRHTGSYASNGILNKGTLTIESGYLTNATSGSAAYVVDNNSSGSTANLTINGGWLYQWFVAAVRQFANSTTYENNVTINGGIVEGYRFEWIQLPGSNASVAPKANLSVTGGDLKSTQASGTQKVFYTYSYGNSRANSYVNISGGTWHGLLSFTEGTDTNNKAIQSAENIEITGGFFKGDIYTWAWWYGDDASQAKTFIKGGYFALNPNGSYWRYGVCPGYGVYDNEDPETMEEFPYVVLEIPVVELKVTENEVPIKVQEEVLSDIVGDEILADLSSDDQATREAAEQAVSEKLHTTETNGLEVWQNYVLGLDSETELNVTAEQTSTDKMELVPSATSPMPNSGFTVSYKMDYTDTVNSLEPTTLDTLDIDLTGENDPTGVYQVKALLTPDNGGDSVVIMTKDKVGVINAKEKATVESDKKTIAVAVPFDGATVATVVNTALLTEGDTLMAYINGKYEKWTLGNDKTWGYAKIERIGGEDGEELPNTTTLARGSAIWVTSADKVVALGKYNESDEIVAATTSETHLLGNPTMSNGYEPIAADKDQAVVGGQRFIKEGSEWTTTKTESVTIGGITIPSTTKVYGKPAVKVGQGFWFIKK